MRINIDVQMLTRKDRRGFVSGVDGGWANIVSHTGRRYDRGISCESRQASQRLRYRNEFRS